MLQFNVQALLDKKDKTRYWLVKQMGTDYATVNKICDNASKSVRIAGASDESAGLRSAGPVYRRMNISRSGGKTPVFSCKTKKGRTVLTVRPFVCR